MPPNTSSGLILDQVKYGYRQVANPYSEAKNACFEECPGTSGSTSSEELEEPEHSAADTFRVTTRARLTYELYNYSKNSMLIVHGTGATRQVDEFKTTFEKFRFEVDVVRARSHNEELYEICGQFFERDFTDYGAVTLVILNLPMETYPSAGHGKRTIKESFIVNNFTRERNPTLADKPKIYITEVDRGRFRKSYRSSNALDLVRCGDVIGFHSTSFDTTLARANYRSEEQLNPVEKLNGPLSIFCKNLAAVGDNVNLIEIIMKTMHDSTEKLSPYNRHYNNRDVTPLEVVSTLSKELYFARV